MYITTQNIFLIPDDAVARNLIIIFDFSSQRPHLNYIFLSTVYSFDTMEEAILQLWMEARLTVTLTCFGTNLPALLCKSSYS